MNFQFTHPHHTFWINHPFVRRARFKGSTIVLKWMTDDSLNIIHFLILRVQFYSVEWISSWKYQGSIKKLYVFQISTVWRWQMFGISSFLKVVYTALYHSIVHFLSSQFELFSRINASIDTLGYRYLCRTGRYIASCIFHSYHHSFVPCATNENNYSKSCYIQSRQ